MIEEWRSVSGYERLYEVSDLGRVRSLHRAIPRIMTGRVDRYGYHNVLLSKDGVERAAKVHRLVCEAFNGPPPDGASHAAHLDGKRLHNARNNLAWASPSQNNHHQVAHGTHAGKANLRRGLPFGEANPRAKLSDEQASQIKKEAIAGIRDTLLAQKYGVARSTIYRITNGQRGIAKTGIARP